MNQRRLKILYLVQLPPPVHGVSVINSQVYASELINEGFEKVLLELNFSKNLGELRRLNFRKTLKLLNLLRQLHDLLKEERPDYVYFSIMPVRKGFWRDLLFVRILRRHPAKILYHLHNRGMSDHMKHPVWRFFYRYAFKDSMVIHLSQELIRQELDPLQLPGIKTFALNNGIPGIPRGVKIQQKGVLTILYLSNFFPEKGIYDALKIISPLRKRDMKIRLRFTGEFMRPKYKRKLERKIAGLGLENFVSIIGPRYGAAKGEEFRKADVFLFPSYFSQECFPLVLLEAMSSALPIVSSRIGAIPEMLVDGENGILCNPGDTEAFTEALAELYADPEKREKLGKSARRTFEGKYTLAEFEKNARALFRENLILY